MKKILLSSVLVIAFGAYVTYNYLTGTTNAQPVSAATSTPSSAASSITVTSGSANTTAGSAAQTSSGQTTSAPVETTAPSTVTQTPAVTTTASTGKYVDGTYTGSVADAYYGSIQVEAVISGDKLSNVVFLQYPNDRSTSRFINQQAMPELKAEAIQSQSANVDGVSGASDSSSAFKVSLASALSKAQA